VFQKEYKQGRPIAVKALSVLQPWAQLLVTGEKKLETRSWQTNYRGIILIHAGRRFPESTRDLCTIEPFYSALKHFGKSSLTVGAILGYATLEAIYNVEEVNVSEQEQTFGDFRPGRYAWCMSAPHVLSTPITMPGKLGIFEINNAVLMQHHELREIAAKDSEIPLEYAI
jgi:activating signal cointegrator 1